MAGTIVVKGRLIGPKNVELYEEVHASSGEVQVIVQTDRKENVNQAPGVFEFLRQLPAGTRDKAELDRQIRQERESWGSRE
jgi:hypothetical protein